MNCVRCNGARDAEFVTCRRCLAKSRGYKERNKAAYAIISKLWKQRNWAKRAVCHSRDGDILRNRVPPANEPYITAPYLERLLEVLENRCPYCTTDMQTLDRMAPDGVTVQRLGPGGHSRANVIICCHRCNVKRMELGGPRCENYLREERARQYFTRLLKDGYADQTRRVPSLS
jgi:hypothetical protein